MSAVIQNEPISDKIIRERTFPISSLRGDRKDVLLQLLITVDNLLSEGFTGRIELNCSQGSINNIHALQSHKLAILK